MYVRCYYVEHVISPQKPAYATLFSLMAHLVALNACNPVVP